LPMATTHPVGRLSNGKRSSAAIDRPVRVACVRMKAIPLGSLGLGDARRARRILGIMTDRIAEWGRLGDEPTASIRTWGHSRAEFDSTCSARAATCWGPWPPTHNRPCEGRGGCVTMMGCVAGAGLPRPEPGGRTLRSPCSPDQARRSFCTRRADACNGGRTPSGRIGRRRRRTSDPSQRPASRVRPLSAYAEKESSIGRWERWTQGPAAGGRQVRGQCFLNCFNGFDGFGRINCIPSTGRSSGSGSSCRCGR